MNLADTIATYRDARDAVMTAEQILDRAHRELVEAVQAAGATPADLPEDVREDVHP